MINPRKRRRESDQKKDKSEAKLTPTQSILLEQAGQEITIRDKDGATKQIQTKEALIRKYMQTAMNGSPHALNQLTREILYAEALLESKIQGDIAKGKALFETQTEMLNKCVEDARAQGLSEGEVRTCANNFLFHPDDFVFDERGYRIVGPFDEVSLASVHGIIALRDAFLLQSRLDDCVPVEPSEIQKLEMQFDNGSSAIDHLMSLPAIRNDRSSLLISVYLNNLVPHRFRLSEEDLISSIDRLRGVTKRTLLKECFQNWKKIGYSVPRGWVSPPAKAGVRAIERMQKIATLLNEYVKDKKTPSREDAYSILVDVCGEPGSSPALSS